MVVFIIYLLHHNHSELDYQMLSVIINTTTN